MCLVPIHLLLLLNLIYLSLSSADKLYKETDPVDIFNVNNLNSTLVESNSDYLIEFYHSYCGHCINYAPIFINISQSLLAWQPNFRVGVYDCAEELNTPLCELVGVNGYPTLLFFPRGSSLSQAGLRVDSYRDLDSMKLGLLDVIKDKTGVKTLKSISNDEWQNNLPNSYILVRCQDSLDSLKVVMEFTAHSKIPLLWSDVNPNDDAKIQVDLIDKSKGNKRLFSSSNVDWNEFSSSLTSKLKDLSLWKQRKLDQFQGAETTTATPSKKPFYEEPIHLNDFLSAITRALNQDVPLKREISGPSLQALRGFINILLKYFQTTSTVTSSLESLNESLQNRDSITRDEWRKALKESNFPFVHDDWHACRGSESYLRGYPCGLWTLFHTLTVAEWKHKQFDDNIPLLVLPSMKAFITTYFSCVECRENFKKESRNLDESMSDPREAVLWLWRTHNSVNQRLSHAKSEDPYFPKIQFPSVFQCPLCYAGTRPVNYLYKKDEPNWNENEAFAFLVSFYDSSKWLSDSDVERSLRFQSDLDTNNNTNEGTLKFNGFSFLDNVVCALISSCCTLFVVCVFLLIYKRRLNNKYRSGLLKHKAEV